MMARRILFGLGLASLAFAWSGVSAMLAAGPLSAHMIAHVSVVAVAAPLLAVALAGGRHDPTRRWPWLALPVAAMVAELVVVWGWHLPLPHAAARDHAVLWAVEQVSFLAVGLALWFAILGGRAGEERARGAGGVVALLLTSMHMTLLGALITLAPRALYVHHAEAGTLADQQIAGMVMLAAAASYLAGGLWLVARLLRGEEEHHASLG